MSLIFGDTSVLGFTLATLLRLEGICLDLDLNLIDHVLMLPKLDEISRHKRHIQNDLSSVDYVYSGAALRQIY